MQTAAPFILTLVGAFLVVGVSAGMVREHRTGVPHSFFWPSPSVLRSYRRLARVPVGISLWRISRIGLFAIFTLLAALSALETAGVQLIGVQAGR